MPETNINIDPDILRVEQMLGEVKGLGDLGLRSDASVDLYTKWVQMLPSPVDDLDESLGPEHKERMMFDSIISSNVHFQITAAMDSGFDLVPLIQDKQNPDYAKSIFCYDVVRSAMEGAIETIPDSLRDGGVTHLVRGHAVGENLRGEPIYKPVHGKERLIVPYRGLRMIPNENVGFIQDPHGNTLAIAVKSLTPNRPSKEGDTPVNSPSYTPEQLKVGGLPNDWKCYRRNKFAVLTNRGRNGDPRGQSILRSIYNEYYLMQAIFPHYLKFLIKFASPSIVGKVSEDARAIRGQVDPTERLMNDLGNFQNASRIALPAGYDLDLLYSQGEGQAFQVAFNLLEQRIIRGITNQMLSNTAARNNIRAAAMTHQDVQNLIVREIKQRLGSMVRRDVISYVVLLNLGPQWLRFAPITNLAKIAPEDTASTLTAVATAWNSGFLHPSQLRGLDNMIGLPYREEPEPYIPPTATATSAASTAPKKAVEKSESQVLTEDEDDGIM